MTDLRTVPNAAKVLNVLQQMSESPDFTTAERNRIDELIEATEKIAKQFPVAPAHPEIREVYVARMQRILAEAASMCEAVPANPEIDRRRYEQARSVTAGWQLLRSVT